MLLCSLDSGILFAIDSMFYNKLNLSISNALANIRLTRLTMYLNITLKSNATYSTLILFPYN